MILTFGAYFCKNGLKQGRETTMYALVHRG